MFDINRKDFYLYNRIDLVEQTKNRLSIIKNIGMDEIGIGQFGIPGIVSGLYIERIWSYSDEEFNEYIDMVKTLSVI